MSNAAQQAAVRLWEAEVNRAPIAPLSELPGSTIEYAYSVQERYVALKQQKSPRVVGRKVGLTSRAMQTLLGVNEPDFGVLLDGMDLSSAGTCSLARLIQPKIEPEIAFRMKKDLAGPAVTLVDALDAIDCAHPALEIIDSRIAGWKIRIVDTIADNASSAAFVLGRESLPVSRLDLVGMGMTFVRNGEVIASGTGSAVLGHPAAAVAWLANTLAPFGQHLRAGEVVLPGALVGAVSVAEGDHFAARFGGLGQVEVNFVQ